LEQYQKLYKILGKQPEVKLSETFSQSVLKQIKHYN